MKILTKKYLNREWRLLLKKELISEGSKTLSKFIKLAFSSDVKVYPKQVDIFRALNLCGPNETKVVIVGQDPYHGFDQANGLAFSVNNGIKIPPSLRNIFTELNSDLNIPISKNGDLEPWSRQGVLLLNTSLTVEESKPGSHQNLGWEEITDSIIKKISEKGNVVFILWGAKAHAKETKIDKENNLIIKSAHPSPFSVNRGFYGSKPFSKTNNFLASKGMKKINWDLSI